MSCGHETKSVEFITPLYVKSEEHDNDGNRVPGLIYLSNCRKCAEKLINEKAAFNNSAEAEAWLKEKLTDSTSAEAEA